MVEGASVLSMSVVGKSDSDDFGGATVVVGGLGGGAVGFMHGTGHALA